jgi:hypothetical protein
MKNKKLRRTATKHVSRISSARLEKMISEATVDCYNESEMAGGLFCMLEQNLAVPFATTVFELEVVVERVDLNDADEIVAVCRRGGSRQRIPILDLPLPDPKPEGAEWIDAYRRWACGK